MVVRDWNLDGPGTSVAGSEGRLSCLTGWKDDVSGSVSGVRAGWNLPMGEGEGRDHT